MSRPENWIWMPHPGHFICARDCRFHLNTCVGDFIVSTVGEYEPCIAVQQIRADSRGIKLVGRGDALRYDAQKKLGYETIGCDRTYETMVFLARPTKNDFDWQCCPMEVADHTELDFAGYNTAKDAYDGHLALCALWAEKKHVPAETVT